MLICKGLVEPVFLLFQCWIVSSLRKAPNITGTSRWEGGHDRRMETYHSSKKRKIYPIFIIKIKINYNCGGVYFSIYRHTTLEKSIKISLNDLKRKQNTLVVSTPHA
jgi:hypothetical protein